MQGRRLLALSVVAVAFGCQDQKSPTGPTGAKAPADPSAIISDGAHCDPLSPLTCNRDFFFLPPMVPLPVGNPNFELGKFNNSLKPSLKIEICELQADYDLKGLPKASTGCVTGPPKKTFAPGTVKLVNLPLRENGWWNLFGLPADGFYYVLWDTRQSNLSVNKFYRIKVLLDGSTVPLGVADVDPMNSLREWKFTRTGEVVQLIDDVLLPIPFRVEQGALCADPTLCVSATVTNDNPNGDHQILRVEGDNGPIAGVLLPDGFLPPGGPQSVVFTITRKNTGANNVAAGTQAIPCHVNLPLQQFNGCFHFSTIPELQVIPGNEEGHQFARAITVAVCLVLLDGEDPREPWVQLWSSEEDGSDAKALPSASDALILTNPTERTCGDNLDVGSINNSNGFTRFASAGWGKLKAGLGKLFGVQTAYAVDFGIGGLAFELSNIGPALTGQIQRYTGTGLTLGPGATTTSTARIVGTQLHHDEPELTTGIGGLPVTFTVAPGHGSLRLLGSEAPGASTVISITNTNPIDEESPTSGGGFAPVNWTLPEEPGTYTLTANGPATGGPVTFTATVSAPPAPVPNFTIPSEAPIVTPPTVSSAGGEVSLSPWVIRNDGGSFVLDSIVENGFFLSTDPVITNNDFYLDGNRNGEEIQSSFGSFSWGAPTLTIPERAPGVYYLGILVDRTNLVAETNEADNYRSSAVVVVDPDEAQVPWGSTERRMLSMQSGATYQVNISPATVASWTSSDPTKATVSSTGLITAIVGNENQNGGGEASITSTLVTGGAGPNMLVNSFSFNLFPRVTTLAWKPIEGAVAYQVVTEFGNGSDPSPPFCSVPATCTTWTQHSLGSTYTTGLSHTFQFVGSQPGRWRVMAIAWNGAVIFTFPYVYFDYDV